MSEEREYEEEYEGGEEEEYYQNGDDEGGDPLADWMSEEDPDDDGLGDFQRPQLRMDFSTAVVVDNIPRVPAEKLVKLRGVVTKLFNQCGTIQENGICIPTDAAGESLGFMFINFTTAEEARSAVAVINNYQLDKRHQFHVFPYERLDQLASVPDEYAPPPPMEYRPRPDLGSWLADENHRDQFVIRYSMPGVGGTPAHETIVNWCERFAPPTQCYGGEREKAQGKAWVELYVTWSPQGTYLASLHIPGIALWGGEQFEKQGRFAHSNVKVIEFSPCENYLLTCNFDTTERAMIVWEVRSGAVLRTFPARAFEGGPPSLFKWSPDGRFIARKGRDCVSIYALPSMALLDKKSLKATGIADFEWSPSTSSCALAYWAPEQDNTPARVSVVEIPSRKDLRQKNLFNVSECRLHWQNEGTYLCVKVLRHSKTKKTMYNNFELFRVADPQVPVEMLELRSNVIAFAWEPTGDRFAIVHGTELPRVNITFYTMKGGASGNELAEVVTLEDKPVNHLYWSPQGQFIVMAAMGENTGGTNGYLNFYDVESKTILRESEHFRLSYLEWDPSGRYICTAVNQPIDGSHWKAQMDNGYRLWSFQGEQFYELTKDNFYQVLWRPRPVSLLSSEEKKKVVRNLKKYERRFERADKIASRRKARAAMAGKVRQKQAFRAHVAARRERLLARHHELVELRDGYDSHDEANFFVETRTREVIMSVKTDIV
ncbi:eukaryotic initiation factor 3b [Tribonema minus]|uniref:Eukaryotic translation initiation factor 3 subunit B n=1 Tax=Tribonema minus TaxID=303371 RepID=A0A835YNH6_9STRA|nr:eukaryotic initiation factor 3b [Tribonema minus]